MALDIPSWRVKVYHLENDGTWLEIGTGNVTVTNLGSHLKVESEVDSSILLISQISHEEIYDRQNENIILWNEVTHQGDLGIALSFQDTIGCSYIWKVIQDIKKNDFNASNFLSERLDNIENHKTAGQLPECNIHNLHEIKDRLATVNPISKESFAKFLSLDSGKYIHQILAISKENELTELKILMPVIADICKSIFYLNDLNIIEILLNEDIFIQVAGCLEYDNALACQGNYRYFLKSICKHKQVARHMNLNLRQQSIKLYQMRYLKDYMLRPAIDEPGIGALNSIILSTTLNICTIAFSDLDYIEAILNVLLGSYKDNTSAESFLIEEELSQTRIDTLRFLRELFQLSRQLQFDKRVELYKYVLESSKLKDMLFGGLRDVLNDCSSKNEERICASEILVSIVIISPSILRKYIMQGPSPLDPTNSSTMSSESKYHQSSSSTLSSSEIISGNEKSFLYVILKGIVEDTEPSVIEQLGDALKVLLDSERMVDKHEKSEFLGLFYDFYVRWLVSPLLEPNVPYKTCLLCQFSENKTFLTQDLASIATSRRVMFDIMILCVQNHSYRMRYFIMRYSILSRCLKILESPYRHLYIGVIKFFRIIVSGKEDFYLRHIIKFDVLGPLFDLLLRLGSKDNLITSAIIEFIEYIQLENIKILIAYIVENHSSSFDKLNHDCVDKLKLKYDQNSEKINGDYVPSINDAQQLHLEKSRKLNEMEMEEEYLLGNDIDNEDKYISPSTDYDDCVKYNKNNPNIKKLSNNYGDDETTIYSYDLSNNQSLCIERPEEYMQHSPTSSLYSVIDTGLQYNSDSSIPTLPPLKSKFELDDTTENNFFSNCSKTVSKISPSVVKETFDHDSSIDDKNVNGISFKVSIKKNKILKFN